MAGYRAKLAREANARLERALERATSAEQDAKERLYQSLAVTAVAERRSGLFGQRFASLDAIVCAAEIHPGAPELRDAAVSALTLADVHEVRRLPLPAGFALQRFSGDFETLFRVDTNGLVHAQRPADGQELYTLGSPGEPVTYMLADYGSGHWLGVGRRNGSFQLWDVAQRRLVQELSGNPRVGLSRDDRWLAELSAGRVRVHDLATSETREIPADGLEQIVCGPGHTLALAAERSNKIRVFDCASAELEAELEVPNTDGVHSLGFAPDGDTLVANLLGGRVVVFDLRQPSKPRLVLQAHAGAVSVARFQPDGDWCLTTSWDGTARMLGLNEGRVLATFPHGTGLPSFSQDGRHVCWLDPRTSDLCLLEVAGREVCRSLGEPVPAKDDPVGPWNLSFLPDGRLLATATYDGVRLYETRLGRMVAELPSTNWFAVCFAGSDALYAVGPHGMARWRLTWHGPNDVTIEPQEMLSNDYLWHVVSSDDGSVVSATGMSEFNLVLAGEAWTNVVHRTNIRSGYISRDGRRLAAASLPAWGGLQIWDRASGARVRQFPTGSAGGCAFNPDGSLLVLNESESAVMWDIEASREVWRTKLPPREGPAAWSPDGRLIAVQRESVVCVLLDAATGKMMARLEHPDLRPYVALAFSPDSGQLACVSTSHLGHLWNSRALRRELTALRLDWEQPPLPASLGPSAPLRVEVARSNR